MMMGINAITVRKMAATRVRRLFERLLANPSMLPPRFVDRAQRVGVPLAVGSYLAGMTDRFCDQQYRQLIELGQPTAVDW